MDMIAMLAGLGETPMTEEERQAREAMAASQKKTAELMADSNKRFWMALGVFAVGAAAGWMARGYAERD